MEAAEVLPRAADPRSGVGPRSDPPGRERVPLRRGERGGAAQRLRRAGAHGRALPQAGRSGGAGGGHQRHPRHAQSARLPGARLGSRGHARGNHLRPRGGAPDSPGRGERLAAERQAHADHRYRRRQRGNHRLRRRRAARGLFQAAGSRAAAARSSWTTIRLRRCQLHQMHEFIQDKLAARGAPPGASQWERTIATSATASAVASAVARLPRSQRDGIDRLRISTAQVRKLYARLAPLRLRRPPQSDRHRTAARRDYRARPGGAAGFPAGAQTARHVLFASRRA